eukprot:scaffold2375_cov107-Isochrysis_galbana.AAC.3
MEPASPLITLIMPAGEGGRAGLERARQCLCLWDAGLVGFVPPHATCAAPSVGAGTTSGTTIVGMVRAARFRGTDAVEGPGLRGGALSHTAELCGQHVGGCVYACSVPHRWAGRS